ncbi:MAG: flagellar biosynthetic protein FliR [Bradymonadia bacterium]|jgi:flagellar biosynthetic protein FliR
MSFGLLWEALVGDIGWTVLLMTLRLIPMVIVLPVFGGLKASPSVRSGVLLALMIGCWPAELAPSAASLEVVAICASQLLFGLATATCMLAVIEAARMAGSLEDTALGRGSFGAADPFGGGASGPLSTLHSLLFLAVFSAIGAHRLVLLAFVSGFESFPLDAILLPEQLALVTDNVIGFVAGAFAAAVAVALPALGVSLVVDISLGWMSRTLPQLPVLFLSMPVRMVLGWIVVAAGLAVAIEWLVDASLLAFETAARL